MRKVRVKYYEDSQRKESIGLFHQWGTQCLEDNKGNVIWTVAIVELEHGQIIMPDPSMITFLEPIKIN